MLILDFKPLHALQSQVRMIEHNVERLTIRLTDSSVALTSVFPYLPEMIESFDVPPDEVAKWVIFYFRITTSHVSLTVLHRQA